MSETQELPPLDRLVQPTNSEDGACIKVDFDNEEAVESAIVRCIADANVYLTRGTVYEIRGKTLPDEPILFTPRYNHIEWTREERAKAWGVAWYWKYDAIDQLPLFRVPYKQAEEGPLGGYVVIARLRCGEEGTPT